MPLTKLSQVAWSYKPKRDALRRRWLFFRQWTGRVTGDAFAGRNVFGNDGARAGQRTVADRYRRDERCIRADRNVASNDGLVLLALPS